MSSAVTSPAFALPLPLPLPLPGSEVVGGVFPAGSVGAGCVPDVPNNSVSSAMRFVLMDCTMMLMMMLLLAQNLMRSHTPSDTPKFALRLENFSVEVRSWLCGIEAICNFGQIYPFALSSCVLSYTCSWQRHRIWFHYACILGCDGWRRAGKKT